MILTPFFTKAKIKVNENFLVHPLNAITMITVSNLHKMHLQQDDKGNWIKPRIANPSPQLNIKASNSREVVKIPPNFYNQLLRRLRTWIIM